LAEEFGALVIYAEHRYYGKSLPFGNNSYTPQGLAYFTSEQALADYAQMIVALKAQSKAESCPVIAFGGSYGGMLSAWFRLKYPHLVAGALAASAPIWLFPGTGVSQYVYNEIITNTFAKADANCPKYIQTALIAANASAQTPAGLAMLSQVFKPCSPLQNTSDWWALYAYLIDGFSSLTMADYPYPTNFEGPMPAWPATVFCQRMASVWNSTTPVIALAAGLQVAFNWTGQTPCYFLGTPTDSADMGWSYQSCTEMVMPIASNGVTDCLLPQAFNYTQITQSCQQQYTETPRADWVTTYYGINITAGSNIFFSQGSLDPWRGGGVQNNLTQSLVCYIIDDGAHHLDLRLPNEADPASVVFVRSVEVSWIQRWINEASFKGAV